MDGDYSGALHTYIYETIKNLTTSIITSNYVLPQAVQQGLLASPSPFKSSYAECVYLRTYSRKKEDGSKERWAETIIRVVEGTISAYITHFEKNGLSINYRELDDFAAEMAWSAFNREWSPPGRGLYAMGTYHTRINGNASLNNCYACQTQDLVLAASWTMDQLMCGGGVGFDCSWNGVAFAPNKSNPFTFVIPDTRQGWVAAVEILLRAYLPVDGEITNSFPVFDYSLIRPFGSPIKGFGGSASGPEPLRVLLERITIFLDTYIEYQDMCLVNIARPDKRERRIQVIFLQMIERLNKANAFPCDDYATERSNVAAVKGKTYGKTRLVVDIMNAIGACVVAGNIRRSAMIAIGDAGDDEFIELKNHSINPERKPISWMSNNTIRFKENKDFGTHIPEIAKRIQCNGEPGFFNLINSQKFARFSDAKYGEDKGTLLNPCITGDTIIKTAEGDLPVVELVNTPFVVFLPPYNYHECRKGFYSTGIKEVYTITLKNGMSIKATSNHRFLAKEKIEMLEEAGWLSIDQGLSVGNALSIDPRVDDLYLWSEIISIEKAGREEVYDCEVDDVHQYFANGIRSHNCGEIILESFEPCTLATICPYNCRVDDVVDEQRVIKAAQYATFYSTIVTCIKHHWGITNKVIAHNRRIGVSLTGISNIYEKYGFTYLTTLCRLLYSTIRQYNLDLTRLAGIPSSIRVTTVKPEGSLSIIMEVNAGVHFPICNYAKRRIAISRTSDILQPLIEANYPTEQSIYDNNMVYVIFPVEFGQSRPTRKVSIYEQFGIVAALQRSYADNSVSFTGHFSRERESDDVERVIAMYAPLIKTCSLLPYSDDLTKKGEYAHMPFEEITEAEYNALVSTIKPVKWVLSKEDASLPRGCTNDTCVL